MSQSKKKKKKKKKYKSRLEKNIYPLAITIIACIIAVSGFIIDTFLGDGIIQKNLVSMTSTSSKANAPSTFQSNTITFENGVQYEVAVFGNAFALITKDGIQYYNEVGSKKWNDTYNMTSPKVIQEGKYIAISDSAGNRIRVYNENGFQYEMQGKGAILQYALNSNGYLSVIAQNASYLCVYVYSDKGVLIKERVEENDGIYPLSSDISSDNKTFAISYIDTNDIVPVGKILFFYVNQSDSQEFTDSIFSAALEKEDEIISKISYMKNDILCAVSDKSISGISVEGIEQWSMDFGNNVEQCSMDYLDYIVIALGKEKAGSKAEDIYEDNTVIWINEKGKIISSYVHYEKITYLKSNSSGIVIGNNNNFNGILHTGTTSWEYKGTSDIYDCIPMTTIRNVMLLTKQEAIIFEMNRVGQSIIEPIIRIDSEEETEKTEKYNYVYDDFDSTELEFIIDGFDIESFYTEEIVVEDNLEEDFEESNSDESLEIEEE